MQIILIIASILMLIMCTAGPIVILTKIVDDIKWYHIVLVAIITVILAIGTACIGEIAANYKEPKAIDVYRGKTTLKITYIDSIPQDTTVVFK